MSQTRGLALELFIKLQSKCQWFFEGTRLYTVFLCVAPDIKYGPTTERSFAKTSSYSIKKVKKNTKFAAKQIIDFYGGDGFFNEMPEPVQAFCNDCAAANALDWQGGPYVNFDKNRLNELLIPATIVSGGNTNTYMKRVTHHLKSYLPRAQFLEINGAGHFLISTHAEECSRILINSVSSA